ncbi:MAG TPA: rRNA methyltransferase, partial [Hellea balneolensis]|nr:rRNA methyltransferase [Hellea balneolensis]
LVYCTCSLEAREGEEQIAKFMKNRPEFRLNSELSISVIGANGALTREGFVRMRPDMLFDKGGMDGFFIAMFTRC